MVAEKVAVPDLVTRAYHGRKHAAGYTREQVEAKAAALEGALRPLTAGGNEWLIRGAGWSEVECVWRALSFAAWVARP